MVLPNYECPGTVKGHPACLEQAQCEDKGAGPGHWEARGDGEGLTTPSKLQAQG
jgi:hypothetical protein